MQKKFILQMIIVTVGGLLVSVSQVSAANTYKFYYSDQCSDCIDILNYVKDDPKAVRLSIDYINMVENDENLAAAKLTCKITQVDLTEAYFFDGTTCETGKDTIINSIKVLSAALPDQTISDSTNTDSSDSAVTNTSSTDSNTGSNTDASKQTENASTTQTRVIAQVPDMSIAEVAIMLIAPAIFIVIAYLLIKRLKL